MKDKVEESEDNKTEADVYIDTILNKLENKDYIISREQFNELDLILAYNVHSKTTWMGYPVEVFVFIAKTDELGTKTIKGYHRITTEYVRSSASESFIGSIALLISSNIEEKERKWVQKMQDFREESIHTIPVFFDLKTQQLIYNKAKPFRGGHLYSYLHYVIESLLSPSLKKKREPIRAIGVVYIVLVVMMIICGTILWILYFT